MAAVHQHSSGTRAPAAAAAFKERNEPRHELAVAVAEAVFGLQAAQRRDEPDEGDGDEQQHERQQLCQLRAVASDPAAAFHEARGASVHISNVHALHFDPAPKLDAFQPDDFSSRAQLSSVPFFEGHARHRQPKSQNGNRHESKNHVGQNQHLRSEK